MENASGTSAFNFFEWRRNVYKKRMRTEPETLPSESELDFDEVSPKEMRKIKQRIKANARLDRRKQTLYLNIIFLVALLVAFWFAVVRV
mgnify:CR=1 FL=1